LSASLPLLILVPLVSSPDDQFVDE
jgi:hypothetical protein